MVALLGLLAVAGYQNRDKIAEALAGRKQAPGGPGQDDRQGSVLDKLGGLPLLVHEEDYYTPEWALDEEEWTDGDA